MTTETDPVSRVISSLASMTPEEKAAHEAGLRERLLASVGASTMAEYHELATAQAREVIQRGNRALNALSPKRKAQYAALQARVTAGTATEDEHTELAWITAGLMYGGRWPGPMPKDL